jgi:hypothetical protein
VSARATVISHKKVLRERISFLMSRPRPNNQGPLMDCRAIGAISQRGRKGSKIPVHLTAERQNRTYAADGGHCCQPLCFTASYTSRLNSR